MIKLIVLRLEILGFHFLRFLNLFHFFEFFFVFWIFFSASPGYTHEGVAFTDLLQAILSVWENTLPIVTFCCWFSKLILPFWLKLQKVFRCNDRVAHNISWRLFYDFGRLWFIIWETLLLYFEILGWHWEHEFNFILQLQA